MKNAQIVKLQKRMGAIERALVRMEGILAEATVEVSNEAATEAIEAKYADKEKELLEAYEEALKKGEAKLAEANTSIEEMLAREKELEAQLQELMDHRNVEAKVKVSDEDKTETKVEVKPEVSAEESTEPEGDKGSPAE